MIVLIEAYSTKETQMYVPEFAFETNFLHGNLEFNYSIIFKHLNLLNELIKEIHDMNDIDYSIRKRINGQEKFSLKQNIYINRLSSEIKIITDKLISIFYIINYFSETSEWPTKIIVDCIGRIPMKNQSKGFEIFYKHSKILNDINAIGNAVKHSFYNHNVHCIRNKENIPVVFAYYQEGNNFEKAPQYISIKLPDLIKEYNLFLDDFRNDYKSKVNIINKKHGAL